MPRPAAGRGVDMHQVHFVACAALRAALRHVCGHTTRRASTKAAVKRETAACAARWPWATLRVMLLRRLYLLAAALVLVLGSTSTCALISAHALTFKSAHRACASLAAAVPGESAALTSSRIKEKCAALAKWTVGVLVGLQTPVAMTDSNGDTVNRTAYSAWGEIEEQVANGIVQAPWQLPSYNPDETGQAALLSNDGQSIGFTGYRKDEDTGLYYAQARWYDPLVGNFNGMDPAMGNSAQPITLNKYVYANGNPLIYIDPSGRAGFLTVMRNGFDRVDEGLRETAVAFPILADQIGVTRGAVALASTPTRMYNLASDVVAQALPGEALRGLSDQGSAELARTVDPMAGLAIDYANDPEGTKIRVAVKVGLAAKDKIVAAAGGDGGARSDIVSFGTQIALPIAGEVALANMGSKFLQSAGYLDDVSRINAQAAARQLERSADNVAMASGKGAQAADAGVVGENLSGVENSTFRGGPHSMTKGPTGDSLDSHHMPAKSVSRMGVEEGPAIQMDPWDHQLTSSHGTQGNYGKQYRENLAKMIAEGRPRDAMATEIRDARRAALEGSSDPKKYNKAIQEMLEYAKKKFIEKAPKE